MSQTAVLPAQGTEMPADGRATWVLGHLGVERISAAETGGAYALIESLVPREGGPPPHVHTREDEAFYVTHGEVLVLLDGQESIAGAGDCVFLPRGVPHTYKVLSETARWLTLVTPAGFEEFFFEFGEPARERTLPPAPDGPPDVERLVATLARYGVTLAL